MSKPFDSKEFLARWKHQRNKEEWLFAVAVVQAGLERMGNLDKKAECEIAEALFRDFLHPVACGAPAHSLRIDFAT